MKFLIAFLAIVGYASASVVAPLVLGLNPGDAQAAVLNANARARDGAQAWTDATRLNIDSARLATGIINQNLGVAAQNQAALESAVIGARVAAAPYGVAPIAAAPYGVAPIAAAPYGVAPIAAAPWGVAGHGLVNGLGLGLRAW